MNTASSTNSEGEGLEFIDAGPSSSRSGLKSSDESLNKKPENPSGKKLFRFNLKRKIMKSRLGKSLSRLDERGNSFEKEEAPNKSIVTEKECHSAVEYLDHSSSSHNDLTGL
ncbi:hypothetical protein FO519_006718 [Halicephalobus sp. NKZ332]|nr:hypothetical protein FO519_006718 [Halicephalobus sp. NKZ332]